MFDGRERVFGGSLTGYSGGDIVLDGQGMGCRTDHRV